MSQPEPGPAAVPAESAVDGAVEGAVDGTEADAPVPVNRAARRAKARGAGPSHVGPRDELERRIRGAGGRKRRR